MRNSHHGLYIMSEQTNLIGDGNFNLEISLCTMDALLVSEKCINYIFNFNIHILYYLVNWQEQFFTQNNTKHIAMGLRKSNRMHVKVVESIFMIVCD